VLKTESFPLDGVIGIVANSVEEIDHAVASNLSCVEIRADLLLDAGMSTEDLMRSVRQSKKAGLAVLFTLRHPSHGGQFPGSEKQRASISRQALDAGADLIDLEWDSEASALLHDESPRLVLSYHDFNGMPDEAELVALTDKMSSTEPSAIKIVPTASTLRDSVRMLQWLTLSVDSRIRRIGFTMGPLGVCSRILTIAFGAPITYASFGDAVAPGQVQMDALLNTYRVMELTSVTSVVAVCANSADAADKVVSLNLEFQAQKINKVAIAFTDVSVVELQSHAEDLRISEVLS